MRKSAAINSLRGKLRFQISSEYTRNYYPEIKKGNKYIYLGVEDNERNKLRASEKLLDLIDDLEKGEYDPNNESKYHIKQIVEGRARIEIPNCKDLFLNHLDWKYKQGFVQESTYKRHMMLHKMITTLYQDISNINSVIQSIENTRYSKRSQRELLYKIKGSIEWGINKKKLPDILLSSLDELNISIEELNQYLKKHKPHRTNKTHGREDDTRYFSHKEMNTIIQAFYDKYGDTNRAHIIDFGFRTGLRTQELFALTWGDLFYKEVEGENVLWIHVNKAYASNIRKVKSTKTDEHRKFQLSKYTQELVEKIKPKNAKDKDLVFLTATGKEFYTGTLYSIWYGTKGTRKLKSGISKERKLREGIVTKLVKQKKIEKYLPAYQMRATFINHMLLAGVNPVLISKWTGHDVKTMMKHYVSLNGSEQRVPD